MTARGEKVSGTFFPFHFEVPGTVQYTSLFLIRKGAVFSRRQRK
jgi:hypothetical protein